MKFATFNTLVAAIEDFEVSIEKLIKIGFSVDSDIVTDIIDNKEWIVEALNNEWGLEKDSCGYTTIEWWLENRYSKEINLKTITYKDKKYVIKTEKDLYNYITKVETKGE